MPDSQHSKLTFSHLESLYLCRSFTAPTRGRMQSFVYLKLSTSTKPWLAKGTWHNTSKAEHETGHKWNGHKRDFCWRAVLPPFFWCLTSVATFLNKRSSYRKILRLNQGLCVLFHNLRCRPGRHSIAKKHHATCQPKKPFVREAEDCWSVRCKNKPQLSTVFPSTWHVCHSYTASSM